MKTLIRRRNFLKLGAAAAVAGSGPALASWPEKPIRLVIPSAAGGSPDVICRILATALVPVLGQPIVVENKPGAAGSIGMVDIVRSSPDGYTLGYGNVGTLAINRSLYSKLPYDPDKQLATVALLGYVQNALVVRPGLGVSTVQALIDLARSRPGKLTMGSAGNGTTGHLGGELFKSMTGTFITHVPYRGSPQAIQDLLGGQVDLMFDNLSSIGTHIQGGRVQALGVSGRTKSPLFPNLPTIGETVPGYETTAWGGIVAPAGTPRDIVMRLNEAINRVLTTPETRDKFSAVAFETMQGPPEQLSALAHQETPRWAAVIKKSGAQVD